MEDEDDNEDNGATMVLFHVNDLYVFRSQAIKKYNDLLGVFPPGLKVFFDARTIPAFRGVTKQAIAVFAGSWPAVPHPTRLAQGPKSKVQCYDLEDDQEKSFFYLELSLKERLDRDLGRFREYADRYGTDLRPQRLSIECGQDQAEWRRRFIPQHLARQQNGFRRKGPKKHFHEFKKAGPYGKSKDKEKVKYVFLCSNFHSYSIVTDFRPSNWKMKVRQSNWSPFFTSKLRRPEIIIFLEFL